MLSQREATRASWPDRRRLLIQRIRWLNPGRAGLWRAWRAGSALLVLGALAACSGADQPVGRVGETLAAGDYQVTVTKLENPAERPDRFTNPKIGSRFVKAELTIVNTGAQHLPAFATHFTLKDSGGIDNPPRMDVSGDKIIKTTSLAPGQRVEGSIYFEMAANESPVELVFAPAVVGWRTRVTVKP